MTKPIRKISSSTTLSDNLEKISGPAPHHPEVNFNHFFEFLSSLSPTVDLYTLGGGGFLNSVNCWIWRKICLIEQLCSVTLFSLVTASF